KVWSAMAKTSRRELNFPPIARTVAAAGAGVALGTAAVAAATATGLARSVVNRDTGLERPITVTQVMTFEDTPIAWLEGEGAAAPGLYSLLFDELGSAPGL